MEWELKAYTAGGSGVVPLLVVFEFDEDIKIEVQDKDIRVDTYRSSGAGGQHREKQWQEQMAE